MPCHVWRVLTSGLPMNTTRIPSFCCCLLLLCLFVVGCGDAKPSFNELMETGNADFEAQRTVDALALFEQAGEIDPERPEPAFFQGRCFLRFAKQKFAENDVPGALLQCDRAIAAFDRAIGGFPGYRHAVQGKTDALKLKGLHEAALEITDWAADQSALHPNLLLLKARAYARSGDMDKAQLTFVQAVRMEPDNAVLHAELGLFYMRHGNDAEAVRSLKRAYSLNPGAPGVVAALARLGALSEVREPD